MPTMYKTPIMHAGHLKKDANGTIQLDLHGVNAQSVLVTLKSLDQWKRCAKWIHGRVLDVGCGSQPYRLLFQGQYAEWIGLDRISPRQPGYPLDLRADAQALPFANEAFDVVVAAEVLEHLPHPEDFWREADRILRPGGRILLSIPFLYWIHESPHDYQRFTQYGLAELSARNAFRIVLLHPRGGALTVLFDLFFKCLSGAFGILNKMRRGLSADRDAEGGLRKSLLGRIFLAWPQMLLGALFKNERLMADRVTAGYMLVAEKMAEKVR